MKGRKGFQPGANHWNWGGDNPSPEVQRSRCIKERGRASEYYCFHCSANGVSRKARDWAHVHEKSGDDVWEDFWPLCRSCHLRYDNTQERNDKKSFALKGKPWSDARRAANKPWHQSEEAKRKISNARKLLSPIRLAKSGTGYVKG